MTEKHMELPELDVTISTAGLSEADLRGLAGVHAECSQIPAAALAIKAWHALMAEALNEQLHSRRQTLVDLQMDLESGDDEVGALVTDDFTWPAGWVVDGPDAGIADE